MTHDKRRTHVIRLEPASKTEVLAQPNQGSKMAPVPPWQDQIFGVGRVGKGEIYKTLLGLAVFIRP